MLAHVKMSNLDFSMLCVWSCSGSYQTNTEFILCLRSLFFKTENRRAAKDLTTQNLERFESEPPFPAWLPLPMWAAPTPGNLKSKKGWNIKLQIHCPKSQIRCSKYQIHKVKYQIHYTKYKYWLDLTWLDCRRRCGRHPPRVISKKVIKEIPNTSSQIPNT